MIHLTPDRIAEIHGMTEHQVLEVCHQQSVPVLHGRIDKKLFADVLALQASTSAAQKS